MERKIIFIAGPTASGKTKIAVETAKEFGGEVVSADSMQIYRGLTIGTAKPSAEEICGIPHHLLDFVDPRESYSAAVYQKDARRVIEEIFSRGKIPIVAGGTGLYFNAVIYDMSFNRTESDLKYREKLEKLYDERGGEFMLEALKEYDAEAAKRLHKNDKKRIVRAIEVCERTKNGAAGAIFESKNNAKTECEGKNGESESINSECGGKNEKLKDGIAECENVNAEKRSGEADEFNSKKFYENYIFIGLEPDRQKLYEKINLRVDEMMKNGLLDEVRGLLNGGLTFDMQCMQSIGYKEFGVFFEGGAAEQEVVENIKQHTRNYAKRQMTWFRRYDDIKRFDSYAENAFFEIKNYIKSQM
ncbi:MAG: tRNA (adenosine(37)-N6)-dimethylallyltransferase MiaA [Clostridiales bacterium]|nr:tRNA (adenosine(37)-N6)-dimethylallyltransferase MiaA [Clostridiales bacterium]